MTTRLLLFPAMLALLLASGCAHNVLKQAPEQKTALPVHVVSSEIEQDKVIAEKPVETVMPAHEKIATPAIVKATGLLPDNEKARTMAKLRSLLLRFGEEKPNDTALKGLAIQVQKEMRLFTKGKRRGFFQRSLLRGQKYIPMIHAVFAEKKLPPEMAWLALVESGFRYRATSRARAGGMWQFMPRTARQYGMVVGRRLDQRNDPYLATVAAREYLIDLISIFGSKSFMLATAGYNAGEYRIQKSLRKLEDPFNQRTFFHLRPTLPTETQHYVPRFLAAVMIASEPSRYGFTQADDRTNGYVMISKITSLKKLSRLTKTSSSKIKQLNPDLAKRSRTPVTHYMLRLPQKAALRLQSSLGAYAWKGNAVASSQLLAAAAGSQVILDTRIEVESDIPDPAEKVVMPEKPTHPTSVIAMHKTPTKVSKKRITSSKPAISQALSAASTPSGKYILYRVKAGNRLQDISQWFNTPVNDLARWNRGVSASSSLKIGQIIRVYGLPYSEQKTIHKVRRGESITRIANRYDVSNKALRGWNGIRGNLIKTGQALVVYHHGAKVKQTSNSKNHRIPFTYTVKRGNFLAGIADTFDVSVRDLKHWNHLRSSRIRQGQKLHLNLAKKPIQKSRKIRRGESLQLIAKRLKVSMLHLQIVNGITNAYQIQAGKKLVYYR